MRFSLGTRRKTTEPLKTIPFFFFVTSSYLVTSTLAKYLHELGHALVALVLGVPLSSMSILVNPFGSGYFRPTRFGFPTSIRDDFFFTIMAAVFPILLLSLVYLATKRAGQMTKWFAGMLLGYSLLSNGVNLISGAFTRSSDGGYLLSMGFPFAGLVAICLLLAGLGATVLITDTFSVIVLSVKGAFQRSVVFLGFQISAIMGLALVPVLGDSFRRRLFFSSFEVLLLGCLMILAIIVTGKQQRKKEDRILKGIPISTWMVLLSGTILSISSLVLYALSGILKT